MEDLLKVVSKKELSKLSIIAFNENEEEGPTDEELKEMSEERLITDEEAEELAEEEERKKEKEFKIVKEREDNKNNNEEGAPEEDIDEEEHKSETTTKREIKEVEKQEKTPHYTGFAPGEEERFAISQLKKLKKRIQKRLGMEEETEEGDTNE